MTTLIFICFFNASIQGRTEHHKVRLQFQGDEIEMLARSWRIDSRTDKFRKKVCADAVSAQLTSLEHATVKTARAKAQPKHFEIPSEAGVVYARRFQ